jgi:hypothetical protein
VRTTNDLNDLQCLTITNRGFDRERLFRRVSNYIGSIFAESMSKNPAGSAGFGGGAGNRSCGKRATFFAA